MIHSRQQARKLLLTLIGLEMLFVVVYGTDAWIQGPTKELHSLNRLFDLRNSAAGLESIGYKMLGNGAHLQLYRVEVAVEEFFEMLGASLILYAVLLCCMMRSKNPIL